MKRNQIQLKNELWTKWTLTYDQEYIQPDMLKFVELIKSYTEYTTKNLAIIFKFIFKVFEKRFYIN